MKSPDDQLTTADIEQEYGVKRGTVRIWRHRGRLRPVGYTNDGRHAALYPRREVERIVCNIIAGAEVSPGPSEAGR